MGVAVQTDYQKREAFVWFTGVHQVHRKVPRKWKDLKKY